MDMCNHQKVNKLRTRKNKIELPHSQATEIESVKPAMKNSRSDFKSEHQGTSPTPLKTIDAISIPSSSQPKQMIPSDVYVSDEFQSDGNVESKNTVGCARKFTVG